MHYVLLIYVAGFIIFSIDSLYCFTRLLNLKHAPDMPDLLKIRPDLKFYLIIKPFLWPYYFVTEKSPIERLSELLFKNYGDKGHTYFGSHGIKNFCNDIFLGKNRYKNFNTKKVIWTVDEEGEVYQSYLKLSEVKKTKRAIITYATHKNKYYLHVVLSNREYVNDDNHSISRFDLDECERLDFNGFKEKLLQINSEKTCKLIKELDNS